MADTTQGDTDGQSMALLVLTLIALIAGLLIHSFIIGVNVNDWWKGRSVTVDHIITSLGISRICAQSAVVLYIYLNRLFLRSLGSYLTLATDTVYTFFIFTNFWLTSLLSIVFCLKVSNLHTRLFLYLRGMIEHRTGYLIGASVLICAFNCLMPLSVAITNLTQDGIYNTTMDNSCAVCAYVYINSIYNYTIGAFIPLLFYCVSSVLLFTSLYRHTTKMKMSSNLSINLETHYSAMRFVSVTFIYNTLYFIGHVACVFYYSFYCVGLEWLHIVLESLPVLHSSYLIYKTAKLSSQMSKVLQNVIDFLSKTKVQKQETT